jgi:hypothetical protein
MAFDLSVSMGDVLTLGGFAVVATVTILTIRSNVDVLGTKVEETDKRNDERFMRIDAQLVKLNEVLIDLTRTEGRMNIADERMLAQGKRIDSMATMLRDLLMEKSKPVPQI